jgi:hypothetical protein
MRRTNQEIGKLFVSGARLPRRGCVTRPGGRGFACGASDQRHSACTGWPVPMAHVVDCLRQSAVTRVGLAPTGTRRLCTAHAKGRRPALQAANVEPVVVLLSAC